MGEKGLNAKKKREKEKKERVLGKEKETEERPSMRHTEWE